MASQRHLPLALLAALAFCLAAPAASAHTAVFSADNKVRGSIGLLDEPVSTYAVTGLDACFTQNTGAPRAPIDVADAANFTVTLRAPSGAVHSAAVEVPFGRPNCITFETPLVLTEPGQYTVDLAGAINGTTFDVKNVNAGGEVVSRDDITFPAKVSSDEDLEARIAALEAEDGKGIPAPAAAITFALLAVLAAVRRLR